MEFKRKLKQVISEIWAFFFSRVIDYRVIRVLIGICCLVFFIFLLYGRFTDLKGVLLTSKTDYLTTNGKVITSRVVDVVNSKSGDSWHYNITYQYVVEAKTYRSSQVSFGYRGSGDLLFAQGYVRKYPVGKQVTVHYLPNDPSFAVLEPDVIGDTISTAVLMGFMLLLAIYCFIMVIPEEKPTPQQDDE